MSSGRLHRSGPSLSSGLADPLTLDAVADLLRVTRNESATRPACRSTRTPRAHLTVIGTYLARMTELRLHFEGQADAAVAAEPPEASGADLPDDGA